MEHVSVVMLGKWFCLARGYIKPCGTSVIHRYGFCSAMWNSGFLWSSSTRLVRPCGTSVFLCRRGWTTLRLYNTTV